MNRNLAVTIAAVVLAGGGALAFFTLRPPPHQHAPAAPSAHGSGMDRAMAAANALYDAQEGKTPCETAYNALKTSDDVAKTQNAKSVVLRLAPRDEFLARCGALSPVTQQCLVPKYLRSHREECVPARPSPDVLKAMVELRQASQDDEGEPPPIAPPAPPR